MCGIAGMWSTGPIETADLAVVTDMLAHRGPDGFGLLIADGGRLGLGHRRLSILDPDPRSRQPMVSEDGRYAIVFNGEIYNFIEIRDELTSRGCRFRTDSDTEVVLHAYATWGPDCQERFNGMWAFAIWDGTARTLFFSRDRFGVKPLLLLETANGTAFASETKAFLALPWPDVAAIDPPIRPLRAGTCATLRGPTQSLEIRRWWKPLESIHPEAATTYLGQVERFRELFLDACRLRLRSDVPVATAISGGLDSSSVLAAVNRLGAESVARRPRDWSRAFTAVAPGTEHDELEYAAAACDAAGVRPVVMDLFQRFDPNEIEEYLYLTEGMPLTNLSAWYLYRTMRDQGIRVSMDGQGADEILAGYYNDAVRILRLEGSWLHRPRRTWDLMRTIDGMTQKSPYVHMGMERLLVLSSPALLGVAERLPGLRSKIPSLLRKHYDRESWEMARHLPPVNSVLFMAVNDGIQDLLERYDLLSMSNSLEVRMPFLDWRLVSYTLSLPEESIIGDGYTKRILRDAMAPYLPPKILRRKPKLQFQGPIKQILERPLHGWLHEYGGHVPAAERILESGTYKQIGELGLRAVATWKHRRYGTMARDRVAALRRRHHAARDAIRTRVQTMH